MVNSIRARVIRGFGASGLYQISNILLQLLLLPVFASNWGPSLYGAWVMLFTAPSFLSLSDFGFGTTSATQMTMRLARGQREEAAITFQSAWLIMLSLPTVLCVAVGVVGALVPDTVLPATEGASAHELRLTLWLLIGYSWAGLQGWMFIGVLRANGDFALGTFTMAIVTLVEGVVAATFVGLGASIIVAAGVYFVLRLVGVSTLIILAKWRAPWLKVGLRNVNLDEVRRLFSPSVASMTIPMSMAGVLQGTAIAIGVAAGPIDVAVFTAIRTLTRSGVQIGSLFGNATAPEFSASYARNERLRLVKLYGATIASSAAVLLPSFVFLCLFGERIMEVWSLGTIKPHRSILVIMTLVMCLHGLWYPVSNLLQAINQQRRYAYYYLVFAAGSLLITLPLAHRYGAIGGAIAMLLLDATMFILIQRLASEFIARPAELFAMTTTLFKKSDVECR
jgi:O-antigen/teichoic acid export membrane protein